MIPPITQFSRNPKLVLSGDTYTIVSFEQHKLVTLLKKLSFLYNILKVFGCLGGSKDITQSYD